MIDTIIIGAGVSGLSYANFCKEDFLVLEKQNEVGGYCKTIHQDDFVWDYSGHFFHFKNEDIKEYLLKNIKCEIKKVNKKTKILYKNKYINFPFQKNIHELSKRDFIDCLYDLFNAEKKSGNSFKDFVISNYGKSISDKFLIPYNEKLYSCDLDSLDKDCMGRFFPEANYKEIINNFKNADNKSYNDTFIYPVNGAFEYIKSLLQNIKKEKILLNTKIKNINYHQKKITLEDGREVFYNKLVSTIPFDKLLDLAEIKYDKKKLTSNKVLVFNLGFDYPATTDVHWMYFPEKKYSFYRIGFYNNILSTTNMSLYVEKGFKSEDDIDINKEYEKIIADLKKAKIINKDPISKNSIIMNPGYCHITKESEKIIKNTSDYLLKYNIHSIGRYGKWTYCSIEDNILEAKGLALNE